MRIATFGCGNMARYLGASFAQLGHDVFFGSRDKVKAIAIAGEIGLGALGGTNAEAAEFGSVIIHTVRLSPKTFLPPTMFLDGKIIVELNNREMPKDRVMGPPQIPSLADLTQADYPYAHVIKAFNTFAQETLDHPPHELAPYRVATFLAGNNPSAKRVVADLARELGLVPVDVGPLAQSWMLEAAGDLIRAIMLHAGVGYTASFSIPVLPETGERLGGRRPGVY